jgi:formylglycine-generating enzyme required for sulfatase activity
MGMARAAAAANVVTNCDAVVNSTGTLGERSYCVLNEQAQVAVRVDAATSKYVKCKWKLIAHGKKANGKPKNFKLLGGNFKQKPVDGAAPLEFIADVSTKLNKKLARKGVQKKLTGNVTDGALELKIFAKPYDGKRFKTTSTYRTTIYLTAPTNSPHLVIDISGGPSASNYPVAMLDWQPAYNEVFKMTNIVLRKLAAGAYVMGSPTNELGRGADEGPQHTVTLTKDFYISVFEITQAQYSNVMGHNPAYFVEGSRADMRPVEQVSWNMARGGTWPGGVPTNTSFLGRLQARTGVAFDLLTEAQWEYACRAGTTTSWNNGTSITNIESDANLNRLGRYWFNDGYKYTTNLTKGAHAVVGSYTPNGAELYDMHGNVREWCLDWAGAYSAGDETDPVGPGLGLGRVQRGGSWYEYSAECRAAARASDAPGQGDWKYGLRIAAPGSATPTSSGASSGR